MTVQGGFGELLGALAIEVHASRCRRISSEPAALAVYPEMKWYLAWLGVNLEMGHRTPMACPLKPMMVCT